ncbi:hypothetical protein PV327_011661, partial [Microctonus hyperodae]
MLRVVSDMTDTSTELMMKLLQLNRELDKENGISTGEKLTSTMTSCDKIIDNMIKD